MLPSQHPKIHNHHLAACRQPMTIRDGEKCETRVTLQRNLALTAAIWHNDHTGQPVKRSLTAYDH
jgi:hypothetical protein